jgi:hypothetical protein
MPDVSLGISSTEGTLARLLYDSFGGSLASATSVFAHFSFDDWKIAAQTLEMSRLGTIWILNMSLPTDVGQMDIAFTDGAGTWDNNSGNNYHLAIKAAANPEEWRMGGEHHRRIAVVGDFDPSPEGIAIANAIHALTPDYVLTAGDNLYSPITSYDVAVGSMYARYINPYSGAYGPGSLDINRFFPIPGNHDYTDPPGGIADYLAYMPIPSLYYHQRLTERIHIFMADSNPWQPDGIAIGSVQYNYFEAAAAASDARWKLFCIHHDPYTTSAIHGPTTALRWPFAEWGVDIVFGGHNHHYERLETGGVQYCVTGGGGKSLYRFQAVPGDPMSILRHNMAYQAMYLDIAPFSLRGHSFMADGTVFDEFLITKTQDNAVLTADLLEIKDQIETVFASPGTVWLENRHKNNISLDISLRLAIGYPVPGPGETVDGLMAAGIYGMYEMDATQASVLYAMLFRVTS